MRLIPTHTNITFITSGEILMTVITVKETKNQWQDPFFTLFVDDEQSDFSHYGSRLLTNTCNEDGDGIFNTEKTVVRFKRKDTWVTVDFGAVWNIALYDDPAREIKNRIKLVEQAFEAVSESYKKVWTVNLDDDNEYIEKRKAEAANAVEYFDGKNYYRVDDYFVDDEDENGNDCFRVVSADGHDDTHLIAFCDIPQEAYFLKLTRIE
jgi:hypothetical protein